MIDISTFAPKDAKIIRENDGKTPYQLLELGLSQKAFERMVSGDYKEEKTIEPELEGVKPPAQPEVKSNIVQPTVREVTKSKTQLTAPQVYAKQRVDTNTGSVSVLNKRTGRTQTMSAHAAKRLLKQPNLYQIVR